MEREKRKKKEKVAKVQGILSAAKKVFSRKGYEATTMEDIAREAGFGKASLYFYFNGKKEVFLNLIKDGLERQRNVLKGIMNSKLASVEKLEAVLSRFFDYVWENREFMRIVHSESQKLYASTLKDVRCYIMKQHRNTMEGITSIVHEGIKSGEFRKVEPTLAAASFMGIIRSVIFDWLVKDEKNPPDRYKPKVMDIFLKGIGK